jgi:hypothetical protein
MMISPMPKGFVGETVKIRASGQLAVVLSDNSNTEGRYANWRAMVRTLDGQEAEYPLIELGTFLPEMETLVFRTAMRRKYPGLNII